MLENDSQLNDDFIQEIKNQIKINCSPRHIPSKVIKVDGIPYTINGKKVEISVKNVIEGKLVTNKEALSNPEILDQYKNITELGN